MCLEAPLPSPRQLREHLKTSHKNMFDVFLIVVNCHRWEANHLLEWQFIHVPNKF